MKKLAISIVTCNRAKHINEDLNVIAQPTKEYGIDIYIYDGSTNMQTERVVKKFWNQGFDHIYYSHANAELSIQESGITRVNAALNDPEAEYVWMTGDKFIISPEHYSKIFSYIDKTYDIITIYGFVLSGTRRFDRVDRFADYAIVPITHWGSTIIKKKLLTPYSIAEECEKMPSFGAQSVFLQAIVNSEKFHGVVIDAGQRVNLKSRFQTKSRSLSHMWLSWLKNWYCFIEGLPSAYDSVREKLYNKPDRQMGFFSFRELLRQRSEGQFDWKKCCECREYVKRVIILPSLFVFCISLLPPSVAKWLWANYRYWEQICIWVKNSVRLKFETKR